MAKHEWSSILSAADPICTKCTTRRSEVKEGGQCEGYPDPTRKAAIDLAEALTAIVNAAATRPVSAGAMVIAKAWWDREMEPAIKSAKEWLANNR